MRGIVLMMLGTAFFTLNDAAMKYALTDMPYGLAIGIRGVTSCLILVTVVYFKTGINAVVWNNVRGQLAATFLYVLASFLYLLCLPNLSFPIAVTAIYTAPLFAVILAWRFLGERMQPVRGVATVIGFIGVVLAVGAQDASVSWVVLLPVGSALATAIRDIKLKPLLRSEGSFSILIAHQVGLALFGLIYAAYEGIPTSIPSTTSFVLAVSASVGSILGVYFVVESFRVSDVSTVSAFRYSAILWAALLGALVWGNSVTPVQAAGMALVIFSGIIVTLSHGAPKPPV